MDGSQTRQRGEEEFPKKETIAIAHLHGFGIVKFRGASTVSRAPGSKHGNMA